MTGRIPFPDIHSDYHLIFALGQKQIPYNAETLALYLPQFSDLLVKCWNQEPNQRPEAPDCLRIIQAAVPNFWPTSITRQMAEHHERLQTLANVRDPQKRPHQQLPPQQTLAPSIPLSKQVDLQSLPQVTQRPQSHPPNTPVQFHQFFAMAFRNWLDQRQLTLDTLYVDGKEVELHSLFLAVGALRGHRTVRYRALIPLQSVR